MELTNRQTIHCGLNFVVAPLVVDRALFRSFQAELQDLPVDFQTYDHGNNRATRPAPFPLEVRLASIGGPISQILLIATEHLQSFDLIEQEFTEVVKAFERAASVSNLQLVAADATIRDLFDTGTQHAFRELWEIRLGQREGSLSGLGRPLLGGGLRFVMPNPNQDGKPNLEVKIESYLQDTTKIFVEATCVWGLPGPWLPDVPVRLDQLNSFVQNEVVRFIEGK